MNKHIKKTKPIQSRRRRALDRLEYSMEYVKSQSGKSPHWAAKKIAEVATLRSRLGIAA